MVARTLTDDEIELRILSVCIERYNSAAHAEGGNRPTGPKCDREIDVREILADLTGANDAELKLLARRWVDLLASLIAPEGSRRPLRPCSDSSVRTGPHRYHARAYDDGAYWPAWERVRQLNDKRSERREMGNDPAIVINNSVVGNVNLGPVLGNLTASVTALSSSGQTELARLIQELMERIPESPKLSPEERREALELANVLSEEMSKEAPRRSTATIRAIGSALGGLLTRAAELATIWQTIGPLLPL